MASGNFTVFNKAKLKMLQQGKIDIDTNAIKAVLTTGSQTLAANFTGTSTDCRYADLTAELATASGYTAGGVTLTSISLTESGGVVTYTSAAPAWTVTAALTSKYIVFYDNTATNKDLVGFMELESGSTVTSGTSGTFTVNPNASGWFTLT